ncbi:MAG: hypothetical protein ACP5OA_03975 [Candidatus Woesearchaeota archaeon]
MNNKNYWFAMIKADNKYYLLCDESGTLTVRDTKEKMLQEFEAKYEIANQTYKNNTSAVHNILFSPSIIGMSLQDISSKLFDLKEGTKVSKIHVNGNGFLGLYCNSKKNLDEIFESGAKPKLGL